MFEPWEKLACGRNPVDAELCKLTALCSGKGWSQQLIFSYCERQHHHVWHIDASIWKCIQESYCINSPLWLDGPDLYLQPKGAVRVSLAAQGNTGWHSWFILAASWQLGWGGFGKGEMVLMNDFRSAAASYRKQSPSPRRPDASCMPLGEKWMNGPLWNKWSLSVWHL